MAAIAGVGAGEGDEVPGRARGRGGRVGVAGVEVGEEPRERDHVLGVVAQDGRERAGRPAAHEVEVAARGSPSRPTSPCALDAEQLALDGGEAGVAEPVAEQAPDDGQQVEMAGVRGRRAGGRSR